MQPRHAAPPPHAHPEAGFRPAALNPRALEVHVTSGMREMPAAIRQEMVERANRLARMHDVLTPRRLAHVVRYAAGAVLCVPLINLLVTSVGFTRWWAQALVALVYGVVAGFARLTGSAAAVLLMGAGIVSVEVTGFSLLRPSYGSLLALMLYYALGLALGTSDDLARDEG